MSDLYKGGAMVKNSLIRPGLKKDTPDHRDYDLVKTQKYAGVFKVPTFLENYFTDPELWMPNQNLPEPIFNNPPLPFGCFPAKTRVLMEDLTYKNIEHITVGDYVLTHKGNKRRVTKIYKRDSNDGTTKIKIKGDFRDIVSTPEHPYFIIKKPERRLGSKNGWHKNSTIKLNTVIEEAKNLQRGDYVVVPKLKLSKDTTLREYEKDPEFLWVLGLYLAEGHTFANGVIFSIHAKEDYFADKVKKAMSKYGAFVSTKIRTDRPMSRHIYIGGKKWAEIFSELGSNYCHSKKINDRLLQLEPSLLMHIVDGFIAGDGHRKNAGEGKSIRFTSDITSHELLSQIKQILIRNDVYVSFSKRKERESRLPAWQIDYTINPHHKTYLEDENNFYVKVMAVETQSRKINATIPVYNLEVEGDNSYIVNNVAVHNCTDYTQADLHNDIIGTLKANPYTLEEITKASERGGLSIRESLKAARKLGWISNFFTLKAYAPLDYFDTIRYAMTAGIPEKRSVSWGTPWYLEWENAAQNKNPIMPAPKDYNPVGLAWHNSKFSGWRTINGVVFLINKSWQGDQVGDRGWLYFSREVVNATMAIPGTVAYTSTAMGTSAKIKTVDIGIVEWLMSVIRTYLPFKYSGK